jgi:hypothetical protein
MTVKEGLMPVVLYDTSSLHPDDLTGILDFEIQMCGILSTYPRRLIVQTECVESYANRDRTFRVFVKTPDLNIVDLTGATGLLTVKTEKGVLGISIQKSTDVPSEGQIGSPDQGEMFFYLVPADTVSLAIRQYVYDIKVTLTNGKSYTVLEGVFNLQQPVG